MAGLDNKISNIIGTKIPQWVLNQLGTRSIQNSKDSRDNDNILYLANKSAWIRLVSSVDLVAQNDLSYFKNIAGSDIQDQTSLAKQFVLFGGTSKYLNKNSYQLRSGIGQGGAYGTLGESEINAYGYKPMPGITSVNIDTQGRLGSIRAATINFKCWDKSQLDIIDALYFKLGFTMFLEWGHTYFYPNFENNKNLDPNKIQSTELYSIDPFESKLNKEQIFRKISQNSRDTEGNYDAMLGIVTNFNFTYTQDGGYDCTLRLMSLGVLGDSIKINSAPNLPDLFQEEITKYNNTLARIEKARLDAEAAKNAAAANAANIATPTQPPPLKVEELINQYLKYDVGSNIYTGARIVYNSNVQQKINKADIGITNTSYGDIFIIRKLGGYIPLRDDLLSQVKVFLDGQTFFSLIKEVKIDLSNEKNIEYSDNVFQQIFSTGTAIVDAIKELFGGPDKDAKKDFQTREIKASYVSQNKLTYNLSIKSKIFATSTDPNVEDIYYPISNTEFIDQFTNVLNTPNNDYTISDLEITDIIAQPGELSNDKVSIKFKFTIPFTRTVNVIEKNQIDKQTLQPLPDKITQKAVKFSLSTELTIEDTRFIKSFTVPDSVLQPIEFTSKQNLVNQNQTQNVQESGQTNPGQSTDPTQTKQAVTSQSSLELILRTIQIRSLTDAINKSGLDIGRKVYNLKLYEETKFLKQIFSTGLMSSFITDLASGSVNIKDSSYDTLYDEYSATITTSAFLFYGYYY
jgi:hypothetical protein